MNYTVLSFSPFGSVSMQYFADLDSARIYALNHKYKSIVYIDECGLLTPVKDDLS